VRANQAKLSREELVAHLRDAGIEATPTARSPVGVALPRPGRVEELLGYAQGWFQVQDEAAQLVGLYAGAPEGAKVLDVCAAPGGKACHLAERHEVFATDLHAHKLSKIEAEARRLGVAERIKARVHDAQTPFPEAWGEFDLVLVDAPCSGLGTLRRHPELRYRRKEEDLRRLAELQRAILENAQAKVAPGGLLVYAVCSTDPEEGADQVELFLRSHPDFTAEPPVLPGLELPQWQGHLRTLPGPEGLDGFFAARLRRMY
jgi:16S rRNA (cytosine967-C5)-methyltransferase